MKYKKPRQRSIIMDEDDEEKLKFVATRLQRSKSSAIRWLISQEWERLQRVTVTPYPTEQIDTITVS